jgi:L-ascorbate metabolism protein UlaG (beta-lactamase superfamily)
VTTPGPAPPVQPAAPRRTGSLFFVGNATVLLRWGPFALLTDPNFLHRGQRAYLGYGLTSRRLTEPAMRVEDVPDDLDAIVLSHLHGDHWDRVTRRELTRTPPVLTTTAAADRIEQQGFTAHGLDTWQDHTLRKGEETLRVEALPGIHARGVLGKVLPPVMGSMLEHRVGTDVRLRVYLSGDTLTGDHLDTIAERHTDIDVAVMHLGGTRVLAHLVTMDAEQGVDFLRRIRPGTAVPVHYDDYGVFRSPLSQFLLRAQQTGQRGLVQMVERGATVELTARPPSV